MVNSTSWIVDRRNDNPNKSAANRERFMRRYKSNIRDAVDRMVTRRSIKDMEHGTDVTIPKKDINEPTFRQKQDGQHDLVRPGNDQFSTGDRVKKPQGGGGGNGNGEGAGKGDSTDEFSFALTKDEFMNILFEGMELPNLARTTISDIPQYEYKKAGFSTSGAPANLSVIRTLSSALGRQIAMVGALDEDIERVEALLVVSPGDVALLAELAELKDAKESVLFLEDRDLRYRNTVEIPKPSSRAVMFCMMDVSGSMSEHHKELAKRFFLLLYLFLTRKYKEVSVVFIRHTDSAEEVDEQTFFYDKKSGGTEVIAGLQLMEKIIQARYGDGSWNIYGAQASDGDAFGEDAQESASFLKCNIMPWMRYYSYIEVAEDHSHRAHTAANATSLWKGYEEGLQGEPAFSMRRVQKLNEIYPALRGLFETRQKEQS